MNTAVVNVKVAPKVKKQARAVAEALGFSLSSYINACLRHLIKTKTIHFSILSEKPADYLLENLKESGKNVEASK